LRFRRAICMCCRALFRYRNMIVCSRDAPTDAIDTGTPVISSMYFK